MGARDRIAFLLIVERAIDLAASQAFSRP